GHGARRARTPSSRSRTGRKCASTIARSNSTRWTKNSAHRRAEMRLRSEIDGELVSRPGPDRTLVATAWSVLPAPGREEGVEVSEPKFVGVKVSESQIRAMARGDRDFTMETTGEGEVTAVCKACAEYLNIAEN